MTLQLFIYRVSTMTKTLYLLKISSKGRGVLITGCDTGFGHRLAIELHDLGFTVFACCLDERGQGWRRLETIGSRSKRLHVIKMDVTNQEEVDAARQYVDDHLPELGLWGVVNNAGIVNVGFIEWVPTETFEKVTHIKLSPSKKNSLRFVRLRVCDGGFVILSPYPLGLIAVH